MPMSMSVESERSQSVLLYEKAEHRQRKQYETRKQRQYKTKKKKDELDIDAA